MTRGIGDPATYYYRRLYVDAVRAVEVARAHPQVDPDRIAVGGGSQGGGLALAAAALAPDRVRLCHADMPFLCDIGRAVEMGMEHPYLELATYLSQHGEQVAGVMRTLAYFDCAHLAPHIRARCLISVGLFDSVCPPSTVFAAYNAIQAPKEMVVYEFSGHDIPPRQNELRLEHFAKEML